MKSPTRSLTSQAATWAVAVWLTAATMSSIGPASATDRADQIAEKFAVAANESQKSEEEKRRKAEEAEMLDRARAEADARALQQRKLEEWRKKLGPRIEGDEQAKKAAAEQRKRETEEKAAADRVKSETEKRAKEAADVKTAEERKAAETKAAEDKRLKEAAEADRKREQDRKAAEAKRLEDERKSRDAKATEDRRKQEAAAAERRREEERKSAAAKAEAERKLAAEKADRERQARDAQETAERQRRLDESRRAADARAEENRRAAETAETKRRLEEEREAEARRLTERLNRANEQRERGRLAAERKEPPAVSQHMGLGRGNRHPHDDGNYPNDEAPEVGGLTGNPEFPDDKSLKDDWNDAGDDADGAESNLFSDGHPTPRDARYTVLLVMEPGRRGIRRFNKKADPVICFGDQCFVSTGPAHVAQSMPKRRALGGGNTFGRRAGACRNSLTCVFRGVDLADVPAVIQPVDLKILIHDRREPMNVEPDMGCRAKRGKVWCRNAIVTPTYRAWIIPEHIAAKAGPAGLTSALATGLNPRPTREAGLRD